MAICFLESLEMPYIEDFFKCSGVREFRHFWIQRDFGHFFEGYFLNKKKSETIDIGETK